MPELPLIARARRHANSVAFRSPTGDTTYQELLDRSAGLATTLLAGADDLKEARVALLAPAGPGYVAAQWGLWRAGAVKVPICLTATEPEWEYALTDSGATAVLADAASAKRIAPLCARLGVRLVDGDAAAGPAGQLPELTPARRAMILYTSGTTSRPKGVVTTHAHIAAQVESLVQAWAWQATDRIPLFLPMHHIHGIINVTSCALWAGATIEPFAKFDQPAILARVQADAYTLFMAVPTIYVKLIQALEAAAPAERAAIVGGFRRMRLMVSGSAALPASVHEQWTALTGQKLLERYGMTEIGMAISNPLRGERRPGAVGQALPGVEVRLKAENGDIITTEDTRARSRSADRTCSQNTGASPPPRPNPSSPAAGIGPATWPCSRPATTGSWAGSRWTSSRAAATNCPPSRSKRRSSNIRPSPSARSSGCPTTPGARR